MSVAVANRPRARTVAAPRTNLGRRVRGALLVTAVGELGAASVAVVALERSTGTIGAALVACACVVVVSRALAGSLRGSLPVVATSLCVGALRLIVLCPAARSAGQQRPAAALFALGCLPVVGALFAQVVVPHLHFGRRDALVPGLVASAVGAAAGVLGAISLAPALPGGSGVAALVPHLAGACAALAIAEVLAYHHAAAGFGWSTVVLAGIAVVSGGAFLLVGNASTVDGAVTATLGAAVVLLAGAVVLTVFSTPRHLVLPVHEVAEGPRLIAPMLIGLTAVAVLVRVVGSAPLWVDDATVGAVAHGGWNAALASARGTSVAPGAELIAYAVHTIAGTSVFVLRAPAILAGALLVPVVYLAGTEMYDRRVGLVAAACAAVAPGVVWLSVTAQAGAIPALLAAVVILGTARVVERERAREWLLFTLGAVALIWSHPLGAFEVGVALVAIPLLTMRRPRPRAFVPAYAAVVLVCVAATAAFVVYRHGFGSTSLLPPLEYATPGAPRGGESLFGFAGAGIAAVFGFHPVDVTSRLLALWPLCMLAGFFLLGRRWSPWGLFLVAFALAPFLALLGALAFGHGFDPPFAMVWVACAVPAIVLGLARVIDLIAPSWSVMRIVAVVLVVVLALALVDQLTRTRPDPRFRVADAALDVGHGARRGDVIVYTPDPVGQVVRFYAPDGTRVVGLAHAPAAVTRGRRMFVIGAFAFDGGRSTQRTVTLVRALSRTSHVTTRHHDQDLTVWTFSR